VRDWPGIWLTSALIAAIGLAIFAAAFPRTTPPRDEEPIREKVAAE
jgi:hypothetical protein